MFSSKKRLLALSVAAAASMTAGQVNSHALETNGIGMYNVLPYYTVQNGLATLIHITNTDTANGKAVKVRFRGAEWSDDVFDFTVFLSPGDIWTGAVTQNGEVASMSTSDKSCTLPSSVNQDFVTTRLEQSDDAPSGTREGYVEIITMADIPEITFDDTDSQTYLYRAIKHVGGVAPCNGEIAPGIDNVLNDLVEDQGDATNLVDDALAPAGGNAGQGMVTPTGTIMSYSINIDTANTKAFTTEGIAVNPDDSCVPGPCDGDGDVDGAQRKIYFTQSNTPLPWNRDGNYGLTADLIFAPQGIVAPDIGGTAIPMFQFDLPDLTTPVLAADSIAHRNLMTAAFTRTSALVPYLTSDTIDASTDVVFNQPTRRFYYWYSQQAPAEDRLYTIGLAADNQYDIIGEDATNADVVAGPPGVYSGTGSLYANLNGEFNTIAVQNPDFWDREEDNFVPDDDIVISPQPPTEIEPIFLVGEVAVISINSGALPTGALQAELTAFDYQTPLAGQDGWVNLSTTTSSGGTVAAGQNNPLPVIGFVAFNAFNAAAGPAGTNYGATLELRSPD